MQINTDLSDVTSATNDTILLNLLHQGNQQAYRQIVNRYSKACFAYACKIGLSHDQAQDILQDSFLQLWQKPPQFALNGSVINWLLCVVRNRSLDLYRATKRKSQHNQLAYSSQQDIMCSSNLSTQIENRISIIETLSMIPKRQERVILLVYLQGLSIKESAQIINTSEHAVESLLARARKTLKKLSQS